MSGERHVDGYRQSYFSTLGWTIPLSTLRGSDCARTCGSMGEACGKHAGSMGELTSLWQHVQTHCLCGMTTTGLTDLPTDALIGMNADLVDKASRRGLTMPNHNVAARHGHTCVSGLGMRLPLLEPLGRGRMPSSQAIDVHHYLKRFFTTFGCRRAWPMWGGGGETQRQTGGYSVTKRRD